MGYIWKSVAWGTVIWFFIPLLGATVTIVGAPRSSTDADIMQFLLNNTAIMWFALAAGLMYSRRHTITGTPLALLTRTIFIWLPISAGWGAVGEGYGVSWFSLGMLISSVTLSYEFIVVPPKT